MRVPRALKERSRTSLAATAANAAPARPAAAPTSACSLDGGAIKHVIYMQFDNVRYTRDNPNVPSDLEQMPNLLNFITGNGTLVSHEHTPLIAHTADDIEDSSRDIRFPGYDGMIGTNSLAYTLDMQTHGVPVTFTYLSDVNNWLWSDHTDVQPTMMELLGLHDDYTPDGRVLIEVIDPGALPPAVRAHYQALVRLGDV
jgi:hypothetical protein